MIALVAKNSPKEFIDFLNSKGINVLYGTENKNVHPFIKYHIDMQICFAGNNTYVCAPECYGWYADILKDTHIKLLAGKTTLGCKYPKDCAYNIATVGGYAIGNFHVCDPVLKKALEDNLYKLINVKQAYAKCNICTVGDASVITSDMGIVNALFNTDLDVLKISSGEIELLGYDYGFIGGASGCFKDDLYFCGDITRHSHWEKIKEFALKHSKQILCSKNNLTDVGTILFLA